MEGVSGKDFTLVKGLGIRGWEEWVGGWAGEKGLNWVCCDPSRRTRSRQLPGLPGRGSPGARRAMVTTRVYLRQ